ncbi:uncharacterized protein LOC134535276 [Bacillus rossius redtenbacheri]|uniref:uncharacterized protein LOC134535276 n=1 Tax=Bacillus rossius redtenbacheri TaxID=93214 RepID=UPI002FDE75A1
MGRIYIRKVGTHSRGQWSEENLCEAVARIKAGDIRIREAARYYNIPESTLRRRKSSGNVKKLSLGPQASLGAENERRLVSHIKRLASLGFGPTQRTVRQLAFNFAERLNVNHRFNKVKAEAGYDWFQSFMERNPDISLRQSQGLSVARAHGLCREEVDEYFALLEEITITHSLFDKPGNIFNVDESGIQLINKPGKVLAAKGSKDVFSLTSGEKGETITVVACVNAEGRFLPPTIIVKGVYKKREFSDGLPPGSEVYMNSKKAYMNSELFLKWFREMFCSKKPPGTNLLILDGHASHCNSVELLELADENNVVLLCLPSHTTHALQPLDRSFFGPLKKYYNRETQAAMKSKGKEGLTKSRVGHLLGTAWKKAASVENIVSGFKACGIYPFNPNAIPDYMFSISDAAQTVELPKTNLPDSLPTTSTQLTSDNVAPAQPGPSSLPCVSCPLSKCDKALSNHSTPTKILNDISPLPQMVKPKQIRRKQSAVELTARKNVEKKKKATRQKMKNETVDQKRKKSVNRKSIPKPRDNVPTYSDESSEVDDPVSDDTNRCAECWENYFVTQKNVDWIKCCKCGNWLHETCSVYKNLCNDCGRASARKTNLKKQK